jgi:putative ABC transport system permease protein
VTRRRFRLSYLRAELCLRTRHAVLTALGLAVGVSLVITVTATAAGVGAAQAAVLHALYGIGTDLTVTVSPPADPGGAGGTAGRALLTGDLGLLSASETSAISRLDGVTKTAGGLLLTELKPAAVPVTVTVDGLDLSNPGLGPFTSGTIIAGHGFVASDAATSVAVVDSRYASASRISVGSSVTVAGTALRVIGIIRQAGGGSDVYLPLDRAQSLSGHPGQVNIVYVATSGPAQVQAEITGLLPSATVTSTANLATAVRGSTAGAAKLAGDLGRWLASIAIAAACGVSSLLTVAAVARRTREIGTLKALGWSASTIVGQLLGESFIIGGCGALAGLGLGFAGIAVVDAIAPDLTAASTQSGGPAVAVRLSAHATTGIISSAVLLAIGCALIAGALGAWRAARLPPAAAFTEVA